MTQTTQRYVMDGYWEARRDMLAGDIDYIRRAYNPAGAYHIAISSLLDCVIVGAITPQAAKAWRERCTRALRESQTSA